jgi:hypothetical protein
MTDCIRTPVRKGPRAAAKREVNELRNLSAAPPEFLQMLEEKKVPFKVQRLMLAFLAELSSPSAEQCPRVVNRVTRRFLSHLEFAINKAYNPDYLGGPATGTIARVIGDMLHSWTKEERSRCDRSLAPDLEQLAWSLESIAS